MNKDLLETQWSQIRAMLKDKFPNLSDDDIAQINGQYDRLVAKLQQRYKYTREEAEDRIKNWNFDRFTSIPQSTFYDKPYREDKVYQEVRKEEKPVDYLKWLMALGLPLLFLLGYFLSPSRYETTTTQFPTVNQGAMFAETPADHAISNGLRDILISRPNIANAIPDVRITTHNGVVTISGIVPNNQAHDVILNAARNYPGVDQVVDNLQVR